MKGLRLALVLVLGLFILSNISILERTITSEQSSHLATAISDFFGTLKYGMKKVLTRVSEILNAEDQEELLQSFNSTKTDTQALSREETREIQQRLIELGYDPGTLDGIVGKGTRLAIYAYQADNGMHIDGKVSPALLAHLRSSQSTSTSVSRPDPIDI